MTNIPKRVQLIRKVLVAQFPNCFCPPSTPKRPLKIKIFEDLLVQFPKLNPKHLRSTLADYTAGPSYQSGLVEGAPRYDLQGAVVDHVTASQAEHAAAKMKSLSAKSQALWGAIRKAS